MNAVVRRTQRGMTTAEYAVGTLAAVLFAGVLVKAVTDKQVFDTLLKIVLFVLNKVFNLGG